MSTEPSGVAPANQEQTSQQANTPAGETTAQKVAALEALFEKGSITEAEFNAKVAEAHASSAVTLTPQEAKEKILLIFREHGDAAGKYIPTAVVNAMAGADRAAIAAQRIKDRQKVPAILVKGLGKEEKKLVALARSEKKQFFRQNGLTMVTHMVQSQGYRIEDISGERETRNGFSATVKLHRKPGVASKIDVAELSPAEKQELLKKLTASMPKSNVQTMDVVTTS